MTFGINRLGYVSGNDYDDPYAPWNEQRDEYVKVYCNKCEGEGYINY